MAAATATPSQLAQQMLAHQTVQQSFSFTPFLQRTYQHGVPSHQPKESSGRKDGPGGGFGSLVCKHWLRGLCKKGESCEFLHEYNLRKMPECNFFVRNGYCSNGDECLYLHIDPQSKLPPCPHYERGFCPLGPRCDKKHVRRKLCPCFLAGFCPDGKSCKEGAHAKWTQDKDMEKPRVKEDKPEEEPGAMREDDRDRDMDGGRDRRDGAGPGGLDRQGAGKDRFGRGGGGGGRWRGKPGGVGGGGGRFRGKHH